MKEKKFKKLVPVSNFDFRSILRQVRLERKFSALQLGEKIHRSEGQIHRYEAYPGMTTTESQYPPLIVIRDLCLSLQIDANMLLGLVWEQSDERYETDMVYEWTLKGDKLFWWCPVCRRENVTYNDFVKKPSLIKTQSVQCEYDDCGSYFEKLHMENDNGV